MALFGKKNKKVAPPPVQNEETDFFSRVFEQSDLQEKQRLEEAKRINEQSAQNKAAAVSQPTNPVVATAVPQQTQAPISQPAPQKKSFTQKTVVTEAKNVTSAKQKCTVPFGISSVIGARAYQQDAAAVCDKPFNVPGQKWLASMCDGMGGMNGGELASQLCISKLLQAFDNIGEKPVPYFYRETIIDIDACVANLRDENGNILGAGSTFTSVCLDGNKLYWASVGDSHIYIIRGNEIVTVNQEHNYMMDLLKMVEAGQITLEQANNDPSREALISYMGIGNVSLMDINESPFELIDGDYVVLCSDGLYRSLSDSEIMGIITSNGVDMQKAATDLTSAALAKGIKYQDNTTVVVIKYNS